MRPSKFIVIAVGVALVGVVHLAPSQVEPVHAQTAPPAGDFSMIFASDPQLAFWRQGEGGVCTAFPDDPDDDHDDYDDCIVREGRRSNEELVTAMNSTTTLGNWPATGLAKSAGAPVTRPTGVILNGDLTAFGHRREKEMYDEIYRNLSLPVYPGLGNHDYENNVGKCDYHPKWYPDHNRCAKETVWWMTRQIAAVPGLSRHDAPGFVRVNNHAGYNIRFRVDYRVNGVGDSQSTGAYEWPQRRSLTIPPGATGVRVAIDGAVLTVDGLVWKRIATETLASPTAACFETTGTAFGDDQHVNSLDCLDEGIPGGGTALGDGSSGSLAYSFDMGDFHFVQLQNWPGYTASFPAVDFPAGSPGFEVTASYTWLKRDLELATSAHKNIVINMHDAEWLINTPRDFLDAIRNQNVVGVFAGHIHQYAGQRLTLDNGLRSDIPVWYSGSAECGTYLYVDFHKRHYNVAVVDATGGTPEFLAPNWTCDTFGRYATNEVTSTLGTYDFNLAPVISSAFVATKAPLLEGSPIDFFATATDPDGDDRTFTWDFGDGHTFSSPVVMNAVHTYADEGSYTVTFTAEDDYGGRATTTFDVTIENAPPTITALDGGTVDENGIATISGTISDPGADDLELTVDWRDGPPESFDYPAGTTTFSITHQYLDDDPTATPADDVTVALSVDDHDGGHATTTTGVRVANVAPTVTATGSAIDENGVATVSGTITDPGTPDTFVLTIDWGEGPPDPYQLPAGTTGFSQTHQYLDDDPTGTPTDDYVVAVAVVDDDGGRGEAAATVTVTNVDPVASVDTVTDLLGSVVGPETPVVLAGQDITLVASADDTGTLDSHTATVDWGDGGDHDDLGSLVGTGSAGHQFAAPGTYELVLTVVDDDTGRDSDTWSVEVVDAAGAIERIAAMLNTLAASGDWSPRARNEIDRAIGSAIGENGGAAHNGAIDALLRGNHQTALVKLDHVVDALADAEAADARLDATFVLRLVGLTAKAIAGDAVARAAAAADRPNELRRVEEASASVLAGDGHLAAAAFDAAVLAYRDAVRAVQSL